MRLLSTLAIAAQVLILFPRPVWASDQRAVVAVFDVQDQSKRLKPAEVAQLGAYLAARVASGGAYTVVPRESLKQALAGKKAESYKSCYDSACQIEIGKELAAEKTLHTEIVALGSGCAVTGTIFDLRTTASERAATEKGKCDSDSLVAALERVADQLGKVTPTSASPVMASAGAPAQAPAAPAAEVLVDLFASGRPPFAAKTKGYFGAMECSTTASAMDCSTNLQPGNFDMSPVLASAVDNYEVEAVITPASVGSSVSGIGITIGRKSATGNFNYQVMAISLELGAKPPDAFLNYCNGQSWMMLVEQRPLVGVFQSGKPVKIVARVKGRRLRVWIDDQLFTIADSPIPLDGAISMGLGGVGHARLDRLIVRDAP